MEFEIDELLPFFDYGTLERGVRYAVQQRVSDLESQLGGRRLLARVRGSGRSHYQVLINTERADGHLTAVRGQCSCPVHYNCKHVVATLMWANLQLGLGLVGNDTDTDADDPLAAWLERVGSLRRPRAAAPGRRDEHLRYVLSPDDGGGLRIDIVKTHSLKSGRMAKGAPFVGGSISIAKAVTPSDRAMLGLLESFSLGRAGATHRLTPGVDAGPLLTLMLGSGRAHWQDHREPPLRLGGPLARGLEWRLDGSGQYRVALAGDGADALLLMAFAPPWYLRIDERIGGPLDTGLETEVAGALVAAPPLPPEQCQRVRKALAQLPGEVPLPDAGDLEVVSGIEPRPRLRLLSESVSFTDGDTGFEDFADLTFLYDGIEISPLDEEESLIDGKRILPRDFSREEDCLQVLAEEGFDEGPFRPSRPRDEPQSLRFYNVFDIDGWSHFLIERVPELRAEGWEIEMDPSFRFHLDEDQPWYAELAEGSDGDWFDLELGIEIDGQRLSLLPTLAHLVRNLHKAHTLKDFVASEASRSFVLSLGDGQVVKLPTERVRQIISTLAELYDPERVADGRLRLSRYQSGVLNQLEEGGGLAWGGADAPRRFAEKLAGFERIEPVAAPAGLEAELRPYQHEGLNWLQFLRQYELGGILADDMGLGKTVQTLAHLLLEKESGRADRPSLVVAPTSLMVNWRREAARFAPGLRTLVLQGAGRARHFDVLGDYDLVLTTYPLLPRDADALRAQSWHLLVLDEAQNIKNPRAKAAAVARSLDARHRLCLTGTPLENHLGELWSQFHFLMPGLLGDEKTFRRLFRKPIEKQADELRQQQLQQRVAPFLLRREKSEVVAELPEKSEILSEVELVGAQRELYETIRVAMHEKVRREIDKKGIERSQIVILDALLKLRQVCCDPRLLKLDAARKVKQSAKLEQLMAMLPEMIEEGRRVLLFSQFTSMLKLIENAARKQNIPLVKLTGQTRDRETPVDRFQNGEVPLFLISLKAGGAGLNLTAADTVIHYDPWWNPAVERQATDRAHRIGQDKAVFVYKLVARGTVEEKITAMQQRKQALADALFGDGKKAARLGEDDLRALFEPLA